MFWRWYWLLTEFCLTCTEISEFQAEVFNSVFFVCFRRGFLHSGSSCFLPVFNECFWGLFLFVFRMVSSYLVHHGYCATAEAFARSTDQTVLEELASIKNRQSKAGKHVTSFPPLPPPPPLNKYDIKLEHCGRISLQHCSIIQFFAVM